MKKLLFICFGLMVSTTVLPAIGSQVKTPPIELQSFSVVCNGEKVTITWKAIAATGNAFFTIEKSKDGINFTKVIDVPSAITNANCYVDYTEVDYKPYKGKSYYRLKKTDKDGSSSFIITQVNVAAQKKISVYHFPISDASGKKANIYDSQEVVVVLRDVQGRELVSTMLLMMEKNVVFAIDEKKLVPSGDYVITSSSEDKIRNYKLIVR